MKFFGSYTYETVKYIKVEDSRLGCLRLILLLGIVLYVGVVEMAYMGGYLEATRVVGAVRLSLQQPRQGSDCSGLAGDFVMNNYASMHMNRLNQAMGDQDGTNCTNAFAPLNTLPYCAQSLLTRDDPSELMKVDQSLAVTGDPEYRGSVFPCQIYEAINAQVIRESSIVVWTRATTQNQTLVCGSGVENTCPQTYEPTKEDSDDSGNSDSNQNQPFYVAQSEAFTLLFEHAATASHICETKFEKEQFYQSYSESGLESESSSFFSRPHYSCSAQAVNYPNSGRLLSLHHGLCQEANAQGQRAYAQPLGDTRVSHAPCYILPNRTSNHLDFFALDVLLKAAGISSLDDCVEEKGNNNSSSSVITVEGEKEEGGLRSDPDKITNATCTTFRESGATILLTVLWNDFMHYKGLIEPYYHYKARIIGTSYKETQAFYSEYRNSRVLFNAHGIKVAVVVGGNFHQFTWLNFIITITTALGMLAVATAVVDAFMLHILPEKDRYQECKYERVARPSSMLEEEDQVQPQPGVEDGVEEEQGREGQHTEQWWQQREPLLTE